tara:strand:- start:445 stop:630 length:186 start_codon:yes stop_codon:yes gene_type:complete
MVASMDLETMLAQLLVKVVNFKELKTETVAQVLVEEDRELASQLEFFIGVQLMEQEQRQKH